MTTLLERIAARASPRRTPVGVATLRSLGAYPAQGPSGCLRLLRRRAAACYAVQEISEALFDQERKAKRSFLDCTPPGYDLPQQWARECRRSAWCPFCHARRVQHLIVQLWRWWATVPKETRKILFLRGVRQQTRPVPWEHLVDALALFRSTTPRPRLAGIFANPVLHTLEVPARGTGVVLVRHFWLVATGGTAALEKPLRSWKHATLSEEPVSCTGTAMAKAVAEAGRYDWGLLAPHRVTVFLRASRQLPRVRWAEARTRRVPSVESGF